MKRVMPINTTDGVARTVPSHYYKAGWHDFDPTSSIPHIAILEIMEEPQIKVAARIDSGVGDWPSRQDDRIYDAAGISPAIAICRTNHVPNIMEEPSILSPIRTEEQRQLRKQGIDTFSGRQMLPRTDGVSNTLTTVQKDNLLQEPIKIRQATAQGYAECPVGGGFDAAYPNSKLRRGRVQDNGDVVGAITASADGHCVYEGAVASILGYTRDDKGNVTSRHEKEIAGTLHTSTGSGGNTDQFVKEPMIQPLIPWNRPGEPQPISPTITISSWQDNNVVLEPLSRKDNIAYKCMPNGNIRAFDASTSDKRGISELQIVNPNNECPTIMTAHEPKVLLRYRIRKLTPRECFRLMDMDDADINLIDAYRIPVTLKNGTVKEKPIPKSAKYKLAGNSIVVSCLYHIFRQMFVAEPSKQIPESIFDM